MENENIFSCVDCIWHDQCEDESPCEFFDRGQSELSEEEINIQIESGRKEYKEEYKQYIGEYSDGE